MGINIKTRRIASFLKEKFDGLIDMSDVKQKNNYAFESRAQAAYTIMMHTDLTARNAADCVVDGFSDCGIDAVYLDESQKTLFVVQSKWQNDENSSISKAEMQEFVQSIDDILNFEIINPNKKLESKLPDIEKAISSVGYQINTIYVHTGKIKHNDDVFRPMKALLNKVNDASNDILVYTEIGNNELYEAMSQNQKGAKINLDSVILQDWGKIDEPYMLYYGTVDAYTIGSWFHDYGNRLFDRNIRFYKGNTDVNSGIKNVLMKEPDKFCYFNNGIKLLCDSIIKKPRNSGSSEIGEFELKGVSLVNGAQTTGCIGEVFEDNPDSLKSAKAIVQIIDLDSVPKDMINRITRLSNTQNKIDNKDFAALDPEQERIRKDMSFSHYEYLFKSGDEITDIDNQITFDEAIIGLACYTDLNYAVIAKNNVGSLSEDITKVPYKALFNPSTNTYVIINSVNLIRIIERALVNKRRELSGKAKSICYNGNRFIEYVCLQKCKNEITEINTSVVIDKGKEQEYEQYVDVLVHLIEQIIFKDFPESYPANIFKNQKKCKIIYDELKEESSELR